MSANEIPPGIRLKHYISSPSRISHLSWSPDGSRVAVGLLNGGVAIWGENDRQLPPPIISQPYPPTHLAWSHCGRWLASCGGKSIIISDSSTGNTIKELEIRHDQVHALSWSSVDEGIHAVLAQGTDSSQRLALVHWSWPQCHMESIQTLYTAVVAYDAASSKSDLLALSLPDGDVEVWDVPSRTLLGSVPAGHRDIRAVSLMSAQSILALGFLDGAVEVWNFQDGKVMHLLSENRSPVYSLEFSPNGSALAGRSADRSVRIWSTENWRRVARWEESGVPLEEVDLMFRPQYRQPLQLTSCDRMNTALCIWEIDMDHAEITPIKVLFLSADPFGNLRLDREIRNIRDELKRSRLRDFIDIRSDSAIRVDDFSRAMLEYEPDIIHFAGHGNKTGALFVEDEIGQPQPMEREAVADFFSLFAKKVRCVLLNACYSAVQASAITKHIEYVIGMEEAVSDKAAIAFSVGFYQALGVGKPVREAFDFGRTQIKLRGLSAQLGLFCTGCPAADQPLGPTDAP